MNDNVHMCSYIPWLTSKKHLEKCPHLLVCLDFLPYSLGQERLSDPGNNA